MRRYMLLAVLAALSLGSAACVEDNPQFIDPASSGPCDEGRVVIEPFDLAQPWAVDILFVVDNSPGMAAAQQALSAAMPRFVQLLSQFPQLDWQLGVTSTDIVRADQQGRLQTGLSGQDGCPANRPRIITPATAAPGTVAACNVVLGETGDNYEAGLEAVRFALVPSSPAAADNEGFLRRDARLVVVVFSNENDCSDSGNLDRSDPARCEWDRNDLISMATYVGERQSFYNRIKGGNAGQPVDFFAIVGPDDSQAYDEPETIQPVCESNGPAYNGRRYLQVVDALGDRGGFASICNNRYENALTALFIDHVLPRSQVICPLLTLTQEPVSVRRVDSADEGFLEPVEPGAAGYLYLGETEDCATGAIELGVQVNADDTGSRQVEVHYCTSDPLPSGN